MSWVAPSCILAVRVLKPTTTRTYSPSEKRPMIEPFQTVFAVPLTCETCVADVSRSVQSIDGVTSVSADLKNQSISVEGTAAPSLIVSAIQQTGRDTILRGSGTSDSAAVCILETSTSRAPTTVHGLARMVQISRQTTLVDISTHSLPAGEYQATVRESGDISRGAQSTGKVWGANLSGDDQAKGVVGTIKVGKNGIGSSFLTMPVQIWEIIGRGMVVTNTTHNGDEEFDEHSLAGVIARSAGVWENDKTVCSCSGKTVWQERKELIDRGML